MNLIPQPPGSSLCGQACVAMVAGITLGESILLFGHSHGTRTRELIRVLNCQSPGGIKCAWGRLKRLRCRNSWPQRAIIKEIFGPIGKRRSHWILLWDGHFYDPDPHDSPGTKYSSYLEIVTTKEEK